MITSYKKYLFCTFILCTSFLLAQVEENESEEQPDFKLLREDEDYSYFENRGAFESSISDPIKYLKLDRTGSFHLSLGGQIRSRFELFNNRFWVEDEKEAFYSQRIAMYSNLVLGENMRVFTEVYNGFTSGEDEFAQDDQLAFFQAFFDYQMLLSEDKKIQIRLGRQELGLGASRLVGIREGPNIRRSFDMGRLQYHGSSIHSMVYYGKEVIPEFGVLDNSFSIGDRDASNSGLWGLNNTLSFSETRAKFDIFYLGFSNDNVTFSDASGRETRHTVGLRRYGAIRNSRTLTLDAEIVYQFGKLDNQDISAWGYTLNTKYQFTELRSKPTLGLKLEYTSGDKEGGDGKIQSYNPLFVNPAFYSLAATIAPVNIISIHPSTEVSFNKAKLYLEWAVFWRNSENDALYRPTRFVLVTSDASQSRSIGHQFGLKSSYELSRNISFDLDVSYFVASSFLEENNRDNNILHIAPTASFKF